MTNIKNNFVSASQILFGLLLVLALSLSFGSIAHAQDYGGSTYDDGGSYGGSTYDSAFYGSSYGGSTYDYSTTPSYGGSTYDYSAPSYGGSTYDNTSSVYGGSTYDAFTYSPTVSYGGSTYDNTTPVYGGSTYENATPVYGGSTYNTPNYASYSAYSYPYYYDYGYSYGYYYPYSYSYYPYSYSYPHYYTYPTVASGGTTNTCVNNSCNTSIVNNPAPTATYTTSSGPSYFASYGSYNNNPPVYITSSPTVIAGVPNVSLSAIPYTGLDLGLWGTIAYWGFLIAWCIVAAYLIAVKRVQNTLADKVKVFLFGESVHTTVEPAQNTPQKHSFEKVLGGPRFPSETLRQTFSQEVSAPHAHDYTDDFILAQIQRRAHA